MEYGMILVIVAIMVAIYGYSTSSKGKVVSAILAFFFFGIPAGFIVTGLLMGAPLIWVGAAVLAAFCIYTTRKENKKKENKKKNRTGISSDTETAVAKTSSVAQDNRAPKHNKADTVTVEKTTAPEEDGLQEHPAGKKAESPVKESDYVPEVGIPTESKEEPKLYDDEGALNPAMEKLEGMSYSLPVAKRETEGFSTDTLFLIRLARKYQGEWDRTKKMFVFPVKKDWDTAMRNRNRFIEESNHKLGFKSIKVKEEEEKKKRSDAKTREQVNKNAKIQSDLIEKRASEFDSELMEVLLKTGDYFINNGTNEYDAFEKKLVTNFGEKVKPYIGAVWNIINAHPENIPFDPKLTTACFEYVGSSLLEGDTIEEIRLGFVRDYERPDLLPLIDVVYAGYNKYMGIESE